MLSAASDTVALQKNPPPTLALLSRRADRDIDRMMKALRANGYYAGDVRVQVLARGRKARVTFEVNVGPPFRLEFVEVRLAGEPRDFGRLLPKTDRLGLKLGDPVQSRAILEAENALLNASREQGHPFPRIEERRVVIDHATRTARVLFLLDPGPPARFGPISIRGLVRLDERFVRDTIPWKQGDPYSIAQVEQAQKSLAQSGLFSATRIHNGDRVDARGELPMELELRERKARSVALGVGYKTDEGFGASTSWENRNLFGRAERLSLNISATELTHAGEGRFGKPHFLDPRQELLLDARVAEEETDAYESRNVKSSATIEREVSPTVTLGGGLALRLSRVDQLDEEDSFLLVSVPLQMDWDTSNDPLDPIRGGRLRLQSEPFHNLRGSDPGFVKNTVSYSRYIGLHDDPMVVLAGRVAAGSLSGSSQSDVPADVRFYAGGGGSIRGYAYQFVGPLEGKKPVGGLSVAEASAELRVKATASLGFVAFLDGGTAFEGVYGNSGEDPLWGAGVGLRYFTVVGPLRVDLGFPLDRRDGMDDRYQLYVSIGQAF
jgi:translocation and assembly module TamA